TNIVEVTAFLKDVLGAIQRGEGLLGAMLRNRELGEATLVDLQHTMANVQETTASLEKILQRIDRGEGLLGQLTSDTKEARELLTHVRRSARSLDALTTRLNRGNGALARLMEDEAYAHRVLGNLDRAISDLADVAAKLDHGQGTLGKLVNDPSLYHDTKALVGGARKSWLLRFLGGGGSAPPADAPPPTAAPAPLAVAFDAPEEEGRPMKSPARFAVRTTLLVTLGFGVLSVYLYTNPEGVRTVFGGVPLIGARLTEARLHPAAVQLTDVKGGYERVQGDRLVFVISGTAVNNSAVPARSIQIEGRIAGAQEQRQVVFCGAAPRDVKELSLREIALLQTLEPPKDWSLAPGEQAAFLVVFASPPTDLREFGAEVVAVQAPSRRG